MPEVVTVRPPVAPRPAMPGSWLAAQGRLPLAFMGLGLAWLVTAMVMLVIDPQVLTLPHMHPAVVALAHAWVLGFFVTVACGAVYQLAPVALGTTLASERYGWWHFGLHAVGVPGMVYSFWRWDLALLAHCGFAVGVGILLFATNTWRTIRRSRRGGTVAWSLGLAAGWLLATVLAGLVLAGNRFWHFIPIDPVQLLRAHAHLGLAGFFVTLLQGVGLQLVPMFTLGEVRDWRWANAGLALSQAGLIGLAPALVWHLGLLASASALAITAAMICSGVALRGVLGTRKKRALDPGTRSFLRGAAVVGACGLVGLALLIPGSSGGSVPGGLNAMVYAVLVVAGGLLPCICGMMCKIIPFLTWMRAYGPRLGRGPVPAAAELAHPRLERWGLRLQFAAVVPLLAGVWQLSETWLAAGVWMLAAGGLLFVTDMLGVLKHLWMPLNLPSPKPASVS